MSNAELVRSFLHAWDEMDFDAALRPDGARHRLQERRYPDAIGRDGVRKTLASLLDKSTPLTSVVSVRGRNADGVVMTERAPTRCTCPRVRSPSQ